MQARQMTKALVAPALAVVLAGCMSIFKSPYDHPENWLIREDPVRSFAVPADLVYVQSILYDNVSNLSLMDTYARSEVGNKRFFGLARVFCPLVSCQKDLDEAVDWYFKNHHTWGRPVIFIGEGEGGRLLANYEQEHSLLKRRGLVASYYTDTSHKGFVTSDMVKEIKEAILRAKYNDMWGREMPSDMLK